MILPQKLRREIPDAYVFRPKNGFLSPVRIAESFFFVALVCFIGRSTRSRKIQPSMLLL